MLSIIAIMYLIAGFIFSYLYLQEGFKEVEKVTIFELVFITMTYILMVLSGFAMIPCYLLLKFGNKEIVLRKRGRFDER